MGCFYVSSIADVDANLSAFSVVEVKHLTAQKILHHVNQHLICL